MVDYESQHAATGEPIMNRNRLAVVLSIAIVMALPFSAYGQATQIRTPVSFTLSGCTGLPAGVTVNGSGESFLVVTTRVDSNGFTHIEQNVLTTGTATASNGANYSFNYHNHASLDIPPGGFPFTVATTDHFNLVGNGKADQLQVHFVARVTFTSPTTFTFEFINSRGNPFACDPI
jgi:hypothetical protein